MGKLFDFHGSVVHTVLMCGWGSQETAAKYHSIRNTIRNTKAAKGERFFYINSDPMACIGILLVLLIMKMALCVSSISSYWQWQGHNNDPTNFDCH